MLPILERKNLLVAGTAAAVTFAIGVIIGYYGKAGEVIAGTTDRFQDKNFVSSVVEQIDGRRIGEYLHVLAKEPHLAASDRDRWLTGWIQKEWEEQGLDNVSLATYEFLLSYPDQDNPNKIHSLDREGNQVWSSRHMEDVLRPEDAHPNFIHAFHAYSPKGDVSGELVYVNYGRVEDLQQLEQLGVNLTGHIAIARYGKIFRGSKVANCERAGAIGLILYSDPQEVAVKGLDPQLLYPFTDQLPESGIQRGSVFMGDGDPQSPGYPSIAGTYRHKPETLSGLPGIPSQPIGYGDAERLLAVMGGPEVPPGWRGQIPRVTYRLGPGMAEDHQGWKVRLVVNNYMEQRTDSNIIGTIRGSEEPDRYVFVGNHRDAWGYGAVDASSGTAALMEIVRTFGSLARAGWRPRRTIVFISWAVEESGLEGSNEYVYDNINKIMTRGVAHINMDICTYGPYIRPQASPVLKDVFIDALKSVSDPLDGTRTLYDQILASGPKADKSPQQQVEDHISILGSGSDHAPFAFYAGIPSVYFSLGKQDSPTYPLYHTGYETFYLMDKIIDPGFKITRSCAQLTSHMILSLAESLVLPFTLRHISSELNKGIAQLEAANLTQAMRWGGAGSAYDTMLTGMTSFTRAAEAWSRQLEQMRLQGIAEDKLRLRALNDQLMLLERVFLLPGGLPDRPGVRHALFTPSKFNSYGSAAFPGISDLLHEVEKVREPQQLEARMERLKRHLSDLFVVFHQAEHWLDSVAMHV